jgi:chromosome partitioning protein
MAYIIAVANEKGGVAKTTTAVSIAGAFVDAGQEVLVIDLDAQANLTLALGVEPTRVRRSITDILMNSASLLSASRETNVPGLDLIPANAQMSMAERFLPIRQNYQCFLQVALEGLGVYDYVIIDCPPSLGAVTLNALTAAQLLIIPSQAEYFSVHALRGTINTVQRIQEQFNPQLEYRILITMLDIRNRIHRRLHEQLQATFSGRVFATTIATDTKLRESSVAGLPITHYVSQTRSAIQYRALAQEIMQYASKNHTPQ